MDPENHPTIRPDPAAPASHLAVDFGHRREILDKMRATIRSRHYSPRTEKAYAGWATRFLAFWEPAKAESLGAADVARFLTHLATRDRVLRRSREMTHLCSPEMIPTRFAILWTNLEAEGGRVITPAEGRRPAKTLARANGLADLGHVLSQPALQPQLPQFTRPRTIKSYA